MGSLISVLTTVYSIDHFTVTGGNEAGVDHVLIQPFQLYYADYVNQAVYETRTGIRGSGHRDACVGTWDLGLGDARQGTWGHQVWDAGTCGTETWDIKYRDTGTLIIIAKVEGKCNISFFVKKCDLWSTSDSIGLNHFGHLMMFSQNIS